MKWCDVMQELRTVVSIHERKLPTDSIKGHWRVGTATGRTAERHPPPRVVPISLNAGGIEFAVRSWRGGEVWCRNAHRPWRVLVVAPARPACTADSVIVDVGRFEDHVVVGLVDRSVGGKLRVSGGRLNVVLHVLVCANDPVNGIVMPEVHLNRININNIVIPTSQRHNAKGTALLKNCSQWTAARSLPNSGSEVGVVLVVRRAV